MRQGGIILKFNNNEMINLGTLESYFDKHYVYLPIIQRNYKWPATTPEKHPEIHSAEKFAQDLWHSYLQSEDSELRYTVGMITLHSEENEDSSNRIQIVDGQQRIITLKLLLKSLDKNGTYFKLDFERDERLLPEQTRKYFLENHLGESQPLAFENTDMHRFIENFKAITEFFEKQMDFEQKKESFKDYIFHNVFILFHLTDVEPIDEFLNINKNKTRFSISDHIKAQLIIDFPYEERIQILKLFSSLSKNLFNDTIWNVTSLGYTPTNTTEKNRNIQFCYPDENRLKILFVDRYKGNSKLGYQKKNDLQYLLFYEKILNSLNNDINTHNMNQLNGFECYYHVAEKKKRYFELLNMPDYSSKQIEEILFEEININNAFVKSCFIQSQLSGRTKFDEDIKGLHMELANKSWMSMAEGLWANFAKHYESYKDEKYSKIEG